MRNAKAKDRVKNPGCSAGLLRGMGSGTDGRSAAELERPSWTTPGGVSDAYKAEPKGCRVQRESEEPIVPRTARRVQPRAGKGLCLDLAPGRR
jgi:hypothetical protein